MVNSSVAGRRLGCQSNFSIAMSVIVHGGAYAIPDSIVDACIKGCARAATEAFKLLNAGRCALDAGEFNKLYTYGFDEPWTCPPKSRQPLGY